MYSGKKKHPSARRMRRVLSPLYIQKIPQLGELYILDAYYIKIAEKKQLL